MNRVRQRQGEEETGCVHIGRKPESEDENAK
jgi:hypothetical protein